MSPEKIAVLVVTVVIAVLLSLTLLSSPGTPVTETAEAPLAPAPAIPAAGNSGAAPLGLQEVLDGGASTQLAPRPVVTQTTPVVAPVNTAVPTTVRVANGETLDVIAKRLYGRSSASAEILAANPGLNPRRMRVGMELKLPRAPTRGTAQPAVAAARTPSAAPATTARTHTVARGERLGGIAKQRYGDANAWRRIYEANRDKLSDPNKLVAGMKLRIP